MARTDPVVANALSLFHRGRLDWEHCLIACIVALSEQSQRQREELTLYINMTKAPGQFLP